MDMATALRRKATIMSLWGRKTFREHPVSGRTGTNSPQISGGSPASRTAQNDAEPRRCPKCRAEVYNLQFCPSCHRPLFKECYSGC